MVTDILLGTMSVVGMAGGISALVLYRKQNGNGYRAEPPPRPLDVPSTVSPEVRVVWPPELAALLTHVAERLEASLVRLESDLAENDKRLGRIAADLAEDMTNNMARFYAGVTKDLASLSMAGKMDELVDTMKDLGEKIADMAAIEAAPVVLAPPDNAALLASSEKLEDAVQSLPARIGQQLSELVGRVPKIGGGSGPPRTPRPAPANLPRITPGMQPAVPQIPASYVSGTISIPAGQPASLLLLIQLQLDPNCPGTSAELTLSTEDDIFVGAASKIGGPLSATNFAYQLTPENSPRTYRSTFPGNNTPIGELQVFSSGGGSLNVEVHQ